VEVLLVDALSDTMKKQEVKVNHINH